MICPCKAKVVPVVASMRREVYLEKEENLQSCDAREKDVNVNGGVVR